jgi:hypothetical protein
MRWTWNVVCTADKKVTHKVSAGNAEIKRPLGYLGIYESKIFKWFLEQ